MPFTTVKVIEGVFSKEQKAQRWRARYPNQGREIGRDSSIFRGIDSTIICHRLSTR